jgi:hypothetical protein
MYQDEELTFEFTEIFSKYEALIDSLFEVFAKDNKTTSSTLYKCFRDVGITSPRLRTVSLIDF